MIVTFISECEKKAHKRTRMILDAFAQRIGEKTWQTNITEIGLNTVYDLLKQSASKSTAVACHKIATRHRTELVWIVGNKSKFNALGAVPVNRTSKELMMNIPITKDFFANTHGQLLSHHLFAVGMVAYHIIKQLEINNEKLAQSAFIAGIFHDLGKIDAQFQSWISKKMTKNHDIQLDDDGVHINGSDKGFSKFSFENHPRHHEISWILALSLLNGNQQLNKEQHKQILHGIYWHHTRPYRTKNEEYFEKATGIDKKWQESLQSEQGYNIQESLSFLLDDVKQIIQCYGDEIGDLFPTLHMPYQCINESSPNYKNYDEISDSIDDFIKEIKPNALNNIVRMAVICADRWVSALSAEDLKSYIEERSLIHLLDDKFLSNANTLLTDCIKKCLDGFKETYPNSERNTIQSEIAKELSDIKEKADFDERHNIAVLQGPAGCGKTKIALEWALNTHTKKIIWVCPRVQVCLGLLQDLTQREYLPNCKIEIFTGEYKKIVTSAVNFDDVTETLPKDYFTGDIVITTIDQVVNNIISHQKVVGLFDFMQSHIVFDEFHEVIATPAFNLLFAELIEAKKLRGAKADVLLVSATPQYYFVNHVLQIDQTEIVRMPSFNQTDYQLEFDSYDENTAKSPLVLNQINDDKTTFVIHNTAQDAQLGFLLHQNNENAILLHSKYTRQDKKEYFNQVFDSFKQHGSKKYQILRSGPITQAALNISCERMYSDFTTAENYLQRLGRLSRFGENECSIYTIVYPKSIDTKKQTSSCAKFLAKLNTWQSSLAWYQFLTRALSEKGTDTIKLNDLYKIYEAFYADEDCKEKIKGDIEKSLQQSRDIINQKVIEPRSTPSKNKKSTVKISSASLRGDQCFVQMAVCEVDDVLQPTFIDEYAYDENISHDGVMIGLTESVDRIMGSDHDDKNLVEFMRKKHHNIMQAKYPNETFKSVKKAFELLKQARSPENPIYLSYTEQDLQVVGGSQERHPFAMYYLKTCRQNVGIMAIDQLQKITAINGKT
ncbi:MAG: CRISPR-associated helicase Cas3' [Acinetobacter sp.]|nr:CRISPR-associated helicase Cas3' [Acinetobacter sp.]